MLFLNGSIRLTLLPEKSRGGDQGDDPGGEGAITESTVHFAGSVGTSWTEFPAPRWQYLLKFRYVGNDVRFRAGGK